MTGVTGLRHLTMEPPDRAVACPGLVLSFQACIMGDTVGPMTKSTRFAALLGLLISCTLSCTEAPESKAQEPVRQETDGAGPENKAAAAQELSEWRSRIDSLDRELVALLNRRAEYVLQLAPLKRQIGVTVRDAQREQEVLRHLSEANAGPLTDESLHQIYSAIMAAMRDLQSEK